MPCIEATDNTGFAGLSGSVSETIHKFLFVCVVEDDDTTRILL